MKTKSVALLILDGWGYARSWGGNAITIAKTPNYDRLIREYPNTIIHASGKDVGLPGHEVGNSEVGHMNLGAGEIVRQDILLINEAIENGDFYKNPVLTEAILQSKQAGTGLNLMGIVSDGGIHSHIIHLYALIKLCHDLGHEKVNIHAFTDGRDSDPLSGVEFINQLQFLCKKLKTGRIATICGRVYLDRKGSWKKTETIYRAITEGAGTPANDPLAAMSAAYKSGETDEYLPPIIINKDGLIKDNDTVIFFNFRSDRTRQLTTAFLDQKFDKFKRTQLQNLNFITFIPYGIEHELGLKARSAFPAVKIENTIGATFETANLKQFHIAETEKYAHVTYFINGNRNEPYVGEERQLITSPNVKSYAEKPEMSLPEVVENFVRQIKHDSFGLNLCNFANGDMVGHTGDFNAAIAAVEALDRAIKQVVDICVMQNVPLIVTADHGNIEQMVDPATGGPHNEHTKNPVPFIVVTPNKKLKLVQGGRLANVAKTCLHLIEMDNPKFRGSLIESFV